MGASTTLRKALIRPLIILTDMGVALFVPSIGWCKSSAAVAGPKRVCQLISRILFHMETIDKIGGMQQAAQTRVAVPKLNVVGAGITYMLLAASRLIEE
jgi:hypothetical protein